MQFKKRNDFKFPPLRNPPIIEALFEIRWNIWDEGVRTRPDQLIDAKYKFFPSEFYQKIKHEYPIVELNPNARLPDELDIYMPRYVFRKEKNKYPLIQIGPGVLTINLDKNFTQQKFYNICIDILNTLFEVLPEIEIFETILHYIDGFNFDYDNSDVFKFLDENLETHFHFSSKLFEKTTIDPIPKKIHLESNYFVSDPAGFLMFQIRTGKKKPENENILLMDTIFRSSGKYKPPREELDLWIFKSDDLIHKWFMKMIDKIKVDFE